MSECLFVLNRTGLYINFKEGASRSCGRISNRLSLKGSRPSRAAHIHALRPALGWTTEAVRACNRARQFLGDSINKDTNVHGNGIITTLPLNRSSQEVADLDTPLGPPFASYWILHAQPAHCAINKLLQRLRLRSLRRGYQLEHVFLADPSLDLLLCSVQQVLESQNAAAVGRRG